MLCIPQKEEPAFCHISAVWNSKKPKRWKSFFFTNKKLGAFVPRRVPQHPAWVQFQMDTSGHCQRSQWAGLTLACLCPRQLIYLRRPLGQDYPDTAIPNSSTLGFQPPGVAGRGTLPGLSTDSCLTLRNEFSTETHILTKEKTLL